MRMPHVREQVVEEYRRCLPIYEDFFQKRQAAKLRKLLADKAALPIAAYEGAILDALRTNSAIVVAGDTGVCHACAHPRECTSGCT